MTKAPEEVKAISWLDVKSGMVVQIGTTFYHVCKQGQRYRCIPLLFQPSYKDVSKGDWEMPEVLETNMYAIEYPIIKSLWNASGYCVKKVVEE